MARPFAWRDFEKRWYNLNTENFPTLGKNDDLQDTINVKVESRAERGVTFSSQVTATNQEKTDAEFSTKFRLDDYKGVEFGFKAKTKPAAEFSVKFDESIFPLDGAALTITAGASGNNEQTVGATLGYVNEMVNLNVGLKYPIVQRVFDFIESPSNGINPLDAQKTSLFADFVIKPVDDRLVYIGGSGDIKLAKDGEPTYYNVKAALAYEDPQYDGGVYFQSDFAKNKKEGADDTPKNKAGVWAFTNVDEVSLGGHAGYEFDSDGKYKGFSFETAAAVQRDFDSKLSAKVQVIPDTIFSVGYEQKLNYNVKLSFGYAFLLNKADEVSKNKSSAFQIGVKVSH